MQKYRVEKLDVKKYKKKNIAYQVHFKRENLNLI